MFISYTAMTNRFYSEWGKNPLLLGKAVGLQRMWFAEAAPSVPATPEVFAAFQRRVHELNGLIILRHERADLLRPSAGQPMTTGTLAAIGAAPPAQPVTCRVLRYRANDLALSVACPRTGFLLLTDRWSRSWTATVNGQPATVDGGDFIFRLVPVAAEENLVEMKYRLPWLYSLVTLSWTTLTAVGVGSFQRRQQMKNGGAKMASLPGHQRSGGCDGAA